MFVLALTVIFVLVNTVGLSCRNWQCGQGGCPDRGGAPKSAPIPGGGRSLRSRRGPRRLALAPRPPLPPLVRCVGGWHHELGSAWTDRKSTRLNSSHVSISYAVFRVK